MEYRVIGSIEYNNKKYCVLMNKKHDKYYMHINKNGELTPLNLQEYLELKDYLFRMKLKPYSNIKIGDKLNFNPLVFVGKRLVPLTLATSVMMSLSGCSGTKKDTIKELKRNGIEVSRIDNSTDLYCIEGLNVDKIKENNSLGLKKEYFDGWKNYNIYCTPGELNNYLNYGTITWDDIIKAVKKNNNLTANIKEILIRGINNLDKKEYNYDLTALYYNLTNLKIKYIREGDVKEGLVEAATFDPLRQIITINEEAMTSESFDFVLLHEAIGHGSQATYVEIEDSRVYCANIKTYLAIDASGEISDMGRIGVSWNEATSDVLASLAQNNKLDSAQSGYTMLVYNFNTIINDCNGTYSDYINGGTDYICNMMENNNKDDPYYYTAISDNELYCIFNSTNTDDLSFLDGILEYIYEIIDDKLEEGYSKEEVYDYLERLTTLNDKKIKYIKEDNIEYFIAFKSNGEQEAICKNDILLYAEDYLSSKKSRGK